MKDHQNVKGFKRRAKQREKASSYFVQLMHSNRMLKSSNQHQQQFKQMLTIDEQLTLLPQFLDTKVCYNILATGPLNEFAMFDVDGEMPTPVETDYTISSHHHHTEATLETEAW